MRMRDRELESIRYDSPVGHAVHDTWSLDTMSGVWYIGVHTVTLRLYVYACACIFLCVFMCYVLRA